MDKQKLIATILTEVKDPELRDKLLKQVAEGPDAARQSILMSELDKLGIDTSAVKDFVGFQAKVRLFIGYLVGGLFFLGGGIIALLNLAYGSFWGALFPGFFAAMGAYALVSTHKLTRILRSTVK